jgi:excisionase family DNA binding protein
MADQEMTVTEAAMQLGVSTVAVRALIGRGRLSARKVGPIYLIQRATVDEYQASVAGRRRPGPAPQGGKGEAAA